MNRLKDIKCFLFDMDGTIYLGNELLPGVADFFRTLRERGKKFYFVTNNSSKGHGHYVEKLRKLGIDAQTEDIIISSDALTYYLDREQPKSKLFVLGTPELQETISKAGYAIIEDETTRPDLVVVGFDMTLTYQKLARACRWIDQGVPYLATHGDVRCPIEGGEYLPDSGAILALIKTATGKEPLIIVGKPNHYIVDLLRDRGRYARSELAMVGDRLTTDIAFGLNNHILSVLVLTGEGTVAEADRLGIHPDVILPRAVDILKYI